MNPNHRREGELMPPASIRCWRCEGYGTYLDAMHHVRLYCDSCFATGIAPIPLCELNNDEA